MAAPDLLCARSSRSLGPLLQSVEDGIAPAVLASRCSRILSGAVAALLSAGCWLHELQVLCKDGTTSVTQADLKSMMAGILLSHPGLEFLQDTPEFQDRYVPRSQQGIGRRLHPLMCLQTFIRQSTAVRLHSQVRRDCNISYILCSGPLWCWPAVIARPEEVRGCTGALL